jgi:hypothetical protein
MAQRRLLAALADSSPAFTPPTDQIKVTGLIEFAIDQLIDRVQDENHELARALVIDLIHARDIDERDLINAVDQLRTATSDVSGADLTDIPLIGVRWSSETRWPKQWQLQTRQAGLPPIRPHDLRHDPHLGGWAETKSPDSSAATVGLCAGRISSTLVKS